MLDLLVRAERSFLIGCGLAVAALVGWTSFAYSAWSSRALTQQVTALTAERDAVAAKHQQLQQAAGELKDVDAKLRSARLEYSQAVEAWAQTKGRLGAAQQELAVLAKRLDQAKDRVAQTGSIRQPDAAKASPRKP